ncbi:MAG: HAD family hydrolase [Isosphaeraceae bacterium]|nr:HAD family hydrolase [Isosphaeraceae bacterium]
MWRWVFLDVGNVLLDEDPLTYLSFQRHVAAVRRVRPDINFSELLALREARAIAGCPWPVYEAVSTYLDEAQCAAVWKTTACEVRARFDELSPVIAGAAELLDHLAPRYRLGLIANQGPECRARLRSLGWLERFEVLAFSEELGWSKPDPRLFLHALKAAGAEPAECLMVGDRLDNDLVPAQGLGLATAWLRWPARAAKAWQPDDFEARAYLASLERSSRAASLLFPDAQPTVACDELRQLGVLL